MKIYLSIIIPVLVILLVLIVFYVIPRYLGGVVLFCEQHPENEQCLRFNK